ncbi:MAG: M14 family metallocarboxypeptidase [Opitutales bacterium]
MAYTGERLDVPATLARVEALAARSQWQLETYGQAGAFPLYVLTRKSAKALGHCYVSTGIHGDEPAGPLALLKMLEADSLSAEVSWTMFPLLNPLGLAAGTRTNAMGIDLNRDYDAPKASETRLHCAWLAQHEETYDLCLALHEDWESRGFYIYQVNRQPEAPSLGRPMLQAVEPICGVDPSAIIEGRAALDGLIEPEDEPQERSDCPEQLYLHRHYTHHGYTLESPSAQPLAMRVEALCAAVKQAQALLIPHLKRTFTPSGPME